MVMADMKVNLEVVGAIIMKMRVVVEAEIPSEENAAKVEVCCDLTYDIWLFDVMAGS